MVRLFSALRSLARDETGAVAVDWITLSALVLLQGIIVVYSIYGNGVGPLAGSVNEILLFAEDIDPGVVQ